MKSFALFLLFSGVLSAQYELDKTYSVVLETIHTHTNTYHLVFRFRAFRTGLNQKTFQFSLDSCPEPKWYYDPFGDQMLRAVLPCLDFEDLKDLDSYGSVIDATLSAFKNEYPKAAWTDSYNDMLSVPGNPKPLDTVPLPASQPDPYFTYLDGTGNTILRVDLTTGKVISRVVVPSTSGPFGIRPTASAGPGDEAWVANAGVQISVVDLAGQKLLTNIPTPSIPQASTPAGIVFTNSGATAFEAVTFSSRDSAGNNGALLVFDAVSRTVKSTMLLKDRPTAIVMAPDGLTAYILDDIGTLTYYDVLSGTADLSVSTYTPGLSGGYPGASSNVFVHPDGTRLFWNVGTYLITFDLTARKISNQFNSGLPTTSAISMQVSQDGSLAFLSDGVGNVVTMNTLDGSVWSTETYPTPTQVFGFQPVQ